MFLITRALLRVLGGKKFLVLCLLFAFLAYGSLLLGIPEEPAFVACIGVTVAAGFFWWLID